jgi:hypothetical protein
VSGAPLSQYFYLEEAQDAAEYLKENHDKELVPYECNRCDFWHLSPKSRITPSKKCKRCTSGDGYFKDTYRSSSEANRRADIIFDEKQMNLTVYQCKYGEGWHLTKRF